jgi:hypothetical protein
MTHKTKRRITRHRVRPYRQGDLDGLCGIYSIVNAVRAICPEVDGDTAEDMFDVLMQRLLRTEANPATAVTGGIGRKTMTRLITEASAYVLEEFDIRLRAQRLPKNVRHAGNLDRLWVHLHGAISPSRVAILGLGGKHSHWTVAVQVTPHRIRLSDSSRISHLQRQRCTIARAVKQHSIGPQHVFLIERRVAR